MELGNYKLQKHKKEEMEEMEEQRVVEKKKNAIMMHVYGMWYQITTSVTRSADKGWENSSIKTAVFHYNRKISDKIFQRVIWLHYEI